MISRDSLRQACKSFTHEACSPEAARGAALLTEILFVRVQQEQPEEESAAPEQQELPPSMALLFGMLLDDAEAVRFATSSTLSRLLLSGATGDSAEDMELEAEPPAEAHAGQSSAPPMEESGWLSLLCGVINTPNLAFARKQAKKQLLLVCGSKQRYSEVRDRALSDEELQNVKQLVDSASPAALDLSYQQKVELCGSLRKLHEMAVAQPRNWSRYCRDGEPTLVFLLQAHENMLQWRLWISKL